MQHDPSGEEACDKDHGVGAKVVDDDACSGSSCDAGTECPGWALTWYRDKHHPRNGVPLTMTRQELTHALANPAPHGPVKGTLPLICLATFSENHRCNDRVEVVRMVGLDIDEPQSDPYGFINSIAAALGGVEVFAYSTHSSMPGAFKLRALVPYDQPASPAEHRDSHALIVRVLSRNRIEIDRKCSDPARGFYVWCVPPSGAYFHAHVEGLAWPVGRAASVERRRASELRPPASRAPRIAAGGSMSVVERARRYVATMPAAVSGAGGHAATFAVARRLVVDFELSDADAWSVIIEFSSRCNPPWSEKELRHKLESARRSARVRVSLVRE